MALQDKPFFPSSDAFFPSSEIHFWLGVTKEAGVELNHPGVLRIEEVTG